MQDVRSIEMGSATARRAVGLGSRQERIGPPERREQLARENDVAEPGAGVRAMAGAVSPTVDEGDIALRVAGHGFDRVFAEFVARVAARLSLVGWVRIGSGEAVIRAVGSEDNLAALVRELRDRAPVDSSVRGFELERVDALPPAPSAGFIALLATMPDEAKAGADEQPVAVEQAVLA